MTKKLKDLEDFMKKVVNQYNYKNQISMNNLRFLVAREIGISDYIQKSIIGALLEFGFLAEAGVGIYSIRYVKLPEPGETIKSLKEDAENEADALLEKMGASDAPE